jgi:hypothetical protein
MAAELVDRLVILVAIDRFPCMVTLVLCVLTFMSVCNISLALLLYLSGVFGGVYCKNSCNAFLLLFMVLWVPATVTLCRRAVLMLWLAFMFLGLRFFPLLFFLFWWSPLPFLVRIFALHRQH